MKNIYEILEVILPAIIAGLFTFFITKYTYNKNRPLDKLEIAYNRIYYPIYKIICDKNTDMDKAIHKSEEYINKYNKYVDISTKRLFVTLCECENLTKKKSIYQKFKNNIFNKSSYLRRRLGYLEPNLIELYKYSIPATKTLIRITFELCVIYFGVVLCAITSDFENDIYFYLCLCLFLFFTLVFIFEMIASLFRFLYYKIKK